MRVRVLVSAVAFLIVSAGAAGAAESPASAERLASATLPGTPDALAAMAGLARPVEPSRLAVEVVRALYGMRAPVATNEVQTRLYLTSIENARLAWKAAGADGTLALPPAMQAPTPAVSNALAALGWRLKKDGTRWRLADGPESTTRQRVLQLAGVDVPALSGRLEAGERVAWPVASFVVPLPLGSATWRALLGSTVQDDAGIGPAMLADRRTALLYYGLMECGPGMLAYAAGSPALLERLRQRSSTFAAFGSSFAVDGGRVATPGGPAYADAWDLFLKRPGSDPVAVFGLLLEHEDGRLAWFYESMSRLEPSTIAFAMGGSDAPLQQRVLALSTLHQVFEEIARGFEQPSELNPLVRPPLDPSLLLLSLRTLPSGRLAPPSAHAFWEAVFETEETGGTVRIQPRGDVDAPYLVAKVFAPVRQHRYDRFDALAFAQRVFAGAGDADLPEAAIALRGFGRYRALLLTLERLGVREPAVHARAVRRAARLGEVRHPHRAAVLYSQFQGALALVERLRLVRRLPEADARRLAAGLIDLEIGPDDTYGGAVSGWIDTQLLPALRMSLTTDDRPILEALAGVARADGASSGPDVVWLDWSYRLDLAGPSLQRLLAIREKQGANTLASALALARIGRGLLDRSLTLPHLRELQADLEATASRMQEVVVVDRPDGRPWSVRSTTGWALAELREINRPERVARSAEPGAVLLAHSDIVLGDVLRSLAYAPYLGDPSGPLLLGGDVSPRHDFGVTIKDADTRLHAAWSVPDSPTGYGLSWQVWGALLGLDVGLATLAVPQVSVGAPGTVRAIGEQSRKAVLQGLALFNPYDLDAAELESVAEAIRRGRARVRTPGLDAAAIERIAAAADLPASRRRQLLWAHEHERAALESSFSMPDLLRLGGVADPAWARRWGAPMVSWNGALGQAWDPAIRRHAETATQLDAPQLAAGFPDLFLRLAELVGELKLPPRLAGPLAGVLVAGFLDEVPAAREDDLRAWSAYAAAYPRSKMEAAVSALTANGVLKPAVQP